jgi:hypothetical protein
MAEGDENTDTDYGFSAIIKSIANRLGFKTPSNETIEEATKTEPISPDASGENKIIFLNGNGGNKAILLDGGENKVTASDIYSETDIEDHNVNMGAGDDIAGLLNGKNLTVSQGDGNDWVYAGGYKSKDGKILGSDLTQLNNSDISQGDDNDELTVQNHLVKDNVFDGGDGNDTVSISGKREDFDITFKDTGEMVVTHSGTNNSNTYKNYEQLNFHDGNNMLEPTSTSEVEDLKAELDRNGVGMANADVTAPNVYASQVAPEGKIV